MLARTITPRHTRCAATVCLALVGVTLVGHDAASGADDRLAGRSEPGSLVTLEVVTDDADELATAARFVHSSGGRLLNDAPGVLLVEVPHRAWAQLDALVDGEVRDPIPVDVRPQRREPEQFGPTTGSQVELTNADAWHAAGFDGTGVKIGIIDFFDVTRYWDVAEHGPLPRAGVDALCLDEGTDCTGDFFDGTDLGGEDHGVAVVELVRDMAPGAQIFIGQAATITDYHALIDWFASKGVRVVNRSLGSRFDGPGDGRGALDEAVAHAVASGILWVNSGGNNGDGRYYRHAVRLVGDRVAFGPNGTHTFLPFRGCVALGGVRWANDWDKPAAERTDYDVYLWESPTGDPAAGQIIDVSARSQRTGADPIEAQLGSHCPGPGSSLYLEIEWFGGDIGGDVIEILDYGAGIAQFTQRPFSAAVSVVDSNERGALGVGAIEPAATGRVAAYSSEGPTNDGRIAPQLTAPSGFANTVFGSFSGTSASAAVVAGGAALLLEAGLAASPSALGDLVRNTTVDRGPKGPDNLYGAGEFRLPAPPDATGIDRSPGQFVALPVPTRFLDTRPSTAVGPPALIGELWRGEILELPMLGVQGIPPSGVTAVAVNIASVEPDRRSYVQALPTRQATLGAYANLNADTPGQSRSNFAVVPIGDDGSISVYSIAEGHVVVDVLGWFVPAAPVVSAGRFVELPTAERLLDTRADPPPGSGLPSPISQGQVRTVPLPAGVDRDHVAALVVTVVAVSPTERGWVQAFPSDRPDVVGRTATVNVSRDSNVANTAIVPIGTAGIAVTGKFLGAGSSHVVVDAIGYITSDAAAESEDGRYVPVRPERAFDSRRSGGPLADGQVVVVDASAATGVDVPDDASGVVWNLAMVDADRGGYVRGWPAAGIEPSTSSLNWRLAGETRASAAVTAVDGGRAQFRVEDGTVNAPRPVGHLVVDVFGYFT